MAVWQPRKRVMTSAIEESNAWLLEKVRGPRRAMIETIKPRRMHPACWLVMWKWGCYVLISHLFLEVCAPFPCTVLSSTPLHCLTISVASDSFVCSTCTEGQTPSLQPAGILFMLQPEDAKLDSREGNRIGQQPPALLHKVWKIITIWKCVIKSLAYQDNWSERRFG